jgi:hypothetical protein
MVYAQPVKAKPEPVQDVIAGYGFPMGGFFCPEVCKNCARIRELLTKSRKYRIIGICPIPYNT